MNCIAGLVLIVLLFAGVLLSRLPFTRHASNGHQGQYSARELVAMADDGQHHTEYFSQGRQKKAIIEIKPGLVGIVIIGCDQPSDPVIVSGYACRASWLKKNLRNARKIEEI
jgi:hypothetical protein